MTTQAEQLRNRTKQLAIHIVRMIRTLPRTDEARIIGRQLLRCSTSVAANYRAACRSRSKAEFTAKVGIVVEEADETVFWLDLLGELEILNLEKLKEPIAEANELLAIFAASQRTAKYGK
jgi:four helix bundle protein